MSRSTARNWLAIGFLLIALIEVGLRRDCREPGRERVPALVGHRFPVQALAFAHGGNTLTTAAYFLGSREVDVTTWDVRTGPPPRSAQGPSTTSSA